MTERRAHEPVPEARAHLSLTELNTMTERRAHEPVPRHERTRALSRTGCNTVYTAVSGPRCANMREISGHSLTELTSITTVCMCPPARLKPVNETRARACSDYDLIVLNATSRHRWRPPSGAGAERNAEPRP